MAAAITPLSTITPGSFPNQEPVDRSGAGLNYQKYQMATVAKGTQLGMGRRTTNDPSSQFSTPLSGGQFGEGHAKSVGVSAPGEY